MPSALAWIAAGILTLVFVWAALAKLLRYRAWREALGAYGFEGWGEKIAAPGVPVVEAVTASLIALLSVKIGAALSLVLLGGFSLAVLRARARRGDRLPCGCFGRTKARDYRLMLLRNGLLVVLAAMVLLSTEDEGLMFGMEAPSAGDVVPALLAALGLFVGAVVLWQARVVLRSVTRSARNQH